MAQHQAKKTRRSSNARAQNRPRKVYLVDGARSPFLKARGRPGPFSPVDFAVQASSHGDRFR
ncbi:hypothetical protein [Marinobacter subterrani]|uniref:Uncharacterized protein n=1 Tax=Marinobacter subterrani TaxID=1658765 RepID=A0A0J7JEA5_9GAMM|nr:hypothetical protein [Marinobacter subterrani]KMQ76209.1 hypothetical protein Msub_12419 [Marinobacter subterrani]